jgi:molybdenum cofactor cytidylyltransferase
MNAVSAYGLIAVLLAAGPSTRLGRPKQLVRFRDESLVRRAARLLTEMNASSVTVVTGCESRSVENELSDLPVDLVHNRNWEQGMGSSIACGVRSLASEAEGLLLMACDQWRMELADLERLKSAWSSDISNIYLASWRQGKAHVSGPPVIFPRDLILELKYVIPTRGVRQLVDRHMDRVEYVQLDNAAFDLDRPEDLERMGD